MPVYSQFCAGHGTLPILPEPTLLGKGNASNSNSKPQISKAKLGSNPKLPYTPLWPYVPHTTTQTLFCVTPRKEPDGVLTPVGTQVLSF